MQSAGNIAYFLTLKIFIKLILSVTLSSILYCSTNWTFTQVLHKDPFAAFKIEFYI